MPPEVARLRAEAQRRQEMIERMQSAAKPREEGFKIALELINRVKEIPGVKGVHLQAIEAEHLLPELIEEAGLLPRP